MNISVDFPAHVRLIQNGVQLIYRFPNNRGASIIRHDHSYGSNDDLWELAVLDSDGEIDYTTPITDDVIGYLNEFQVSEILTEIKRLPED